MGAVRPPDTIATAPVTRACLILLSRIPQAGSLKRRASGIEKANAKNSAVVDMCRDSRS